MNKTKIEWCDSTWNPVTGCFHNCEYCYARGIAHRFGGASETHNNETCNECQWFTEAEGKIHELDEPVYDYDRQHYAPYPFEFDPTLHRYRLDEYEKKKGRTIFVCSMSDLFGSWVPDSWIEEVFAACKKAPQHRYLFLTKNPNRYIELAKKGLLPQSDNMWYGYSATRQSELWTFKHADECPAIHLFVSIEPILEPIVPGFSSHCPADWVIIGAETGHRKAKVTPVRKWIEQIEMECEYSGRPLFMKDSLAPIVGEKNMRREFPWDQQFKSVAKEAGMQATQEVLQSAT